MRPLRIDWFRRYERLLWIGLVVSVVFLRWPFLKGMYYRTAHVEAKASSIAWRTDLRAALAESQRTGRPVLVDFSASWCPPCIVMKHDVWTDPAVEEAISGAYVPLLIDIDRDPITSDNFGIDAIPSILVLDSDGRVIRRAGFLSSSDALQFVRAGSSR